MLMLRSIETHSYVYLPEVERQAILSDIHRVGM